VDDFKLVSLPQGIRLYIHIPFCRSKCPYCDFYSVSDAGPELTEAIVKGTLAELKHFLALLGRPPLQSVYIGGGTPSLLHPDLLDNLLAAVAVEIERRANKNVPEHDECIEYTIEANPESLSRRFLKICARRGVNRLSLGVQSFRPRLLRTLGRPGNAEHNLQALTLATEYWRGSLNLDLLAGIPGQQAEDLDEDLRQAIAARPDHVSLYALSPPAGSSLAGQIEPRQQEELWFRGFETLEAWGYQNYEIANFALPGRECGHNLGYWQLDPYLGVGPGAVSTLPGAGGEVFRLYNPHDLSLFRQGQAAGWGLQRERVTPREFLFEHLMLGFRLRRGVDAGRFCARFGASLPNMLPKLWASWRRRDLVAGESGSWRLSDEGRFILDSLLVEVQEALDSLPDEALRFDWALCRDGR
jgi:oxygen-independent coproporphyrinogen-3 oxidase